MNLVRIVLRHGSILIMLLRRFGQTPNHKLTQLNTYIKFKNKISIHFTIFTLSSNNSIPFLVNSKYPFFLYPLETTYPCFFKYAISLCAVVRIMHLNSLEI